MTSPALVVLAATFPVPTALGAALGRVLRDHPYAASGTLHADSPRVAADAMVLWGRLVDCADDRLPTAITELRSRDIHVLAATARQRFPDPACLRVLAAVIASRDVPGADALAWDAWLFTNGDERFRTAAAGFASTAASAPPFWRRLLSGLTPATVASAAFLDERVAFDAWAARRDVSLTGHRRFLDHVIDALLAPGGLAALDRAQPSEQIARWAARLPSAEKDAWYAAFLNETRAAHSRLRGSARWPARHTVCAAVLARVGAPSDELPFWDAVDPGARDAFALWCKDHQLTEFLGENERVEFWRRYLPSIVRVEPNRMYSVVFIHGRGWVAIQFVSSGRATFLCKEAATRGWRRLDEIELYQRVLDLRRRHSPDFLGSYEHRGYAATWQRSASDEVEAVIGRAEAEVRT